MSSQDTLRADGSAASTPASAAAAAAPALAAAAAAAAAMAAPVHYCPVATLTDTFHQSGAIVELEVRRRWPLDTDASADPPRHVLRLEAHDFCRAGSVDTPIEIFLHGLWANVIIQEDDVLRISRALVLPGVDDAEHRWRLVLDESAACRDTTLCIKGWKQRLLLREGREFTLAGLERQQEEAEEAAAVAAEQRAAEASRLKQAGPPAKKAKTKGGAAAAASSAFQTAADLAAGSAAEPILLDDSATDGADAGTGGAAAGKKKRKRVGDPYMYTPLGEVRKHLHKKLNFYGVVIRARPVIKTGGTDFMLSLVVSDMSIGSVTDAVTFNVFRKSASALPDHATIAPGDVVRLHRASVAPNAKSPDQLVGLLTDKGGSGFLLIRGGVDESMVPYFHSGETYSELDEEIVHDLRQWSKEKLDFRLGFGGGGGAGGGGGGAAAQDRHRENLRTFSALHALPGQYFDAYCAVVFTDTTGTLPQRMGLAPGAAPALAGVPSVPIAYVWDGTDLHPSVKLQRPLLPNRREVPIAAAAAASAGSAAAAAAAASSASSNSKPLVTPSFGSILPLVLTQSNALSSFLPRAGTPPTQALFVRLQNVIFKAGPDGLHYLQFFKLSKLRHLTPADPNIKLMLQTHEARVLQESAQRRLMPWSTVRTLLTMPKEPTLPLTPIKWLLSSEAAAVSKSRVRARVIVPYAMDAESAVEGAAAAAAVPPAESKEGEAEAAPAATAAAAAPSNLLPLESICKVECHNCSVWFSCSSTPSVPDRCATCGSDEQLSYGYFVRLLLQDSTGLLPVLLCGKEAEHDLFHMPADNLHFNRTARRLVHERLATFMAPGAFIDSNVHSYEVAERVDAEGAAAADGSQAFTGSQEFMSQDLSAFFAPQLPNGEEMGDEEEGSERQPPMRMRRVHRLVDCNFKRQI